MCLDQRGDDDTRVHQHEGGVEAAFLDGRDDLPAAVKRPGGGPPGEKEPHRAREHQRRYLDHAVGCDQREDPARCETGSEAGVHGDAERDAVERQDPQRDHTEAADEAGSHQPVVTDVLQYGVPTDDTATRDRHVLGDRRADERVPDQGGQAERRRRQRQVRGELADSRPERGGRPAERCQSARPVLALCRRVGRSIGPGRVAHPPPRVWTTCPSTTSTRRSA